jgi:tryptophan synthase alpha chain
MNRIDRIFADRRAKGLKTLMPFVCGGSPTLEVTKAVLPALERAGASIVEIGIPFSDPIADGPVIAAAMHTALTKGVTPEGVFDAVGAVRGTTGLGLVAMVSVSIVQRMEAANFAKRAAAAGFDGVILPDVPLEETGRTLGPIKDAGLTCTLLVAPTTPVERAAKIAAACSGFIYLLARLGITGGGNDVGVDGSGIAQRVAMLRGVSDLPIACGFGISTAEHVRAVVSQSGGGADAAIVGSALVRAMVDAGDAVGEGERMVRGLAGGLS